MPTYLFLSSYAPTTTTTTATKKVLNYGSTMTKYLVHGVNVSTVPHYRIRKQVTTLKSGKHQQADGATFCFALMKRNSRRHTQAHTHTLIHTRASGHTSTGHTSERRQPDFCTGGAAMTQSITCHIFRVHQKESSVCTKRVCTSCTSCMVVSKESSVCTSCMVVSKECVPRNPQYFFVLEPSRAVFAAQGLVHLEKRLAMAKMSQQPLQ